MQLCETLFSIEHLDGSSVTCTAWSCLQGVGFQADLIDGGNQMFGSLPLHRDRRGGRGDAMDAHRWLWALVFKYLIQYI